MLVYCIGRDGKEKPLTSIVAMLLRKAASGGGGGAVSFLFFPITVTAREICNFVENSTWVKKQLKFHWVSVDVHILPAP